MSPAVAYKTITEHIKPTPIQTWHFGRMIKRINAGLFEELAGDPNESIRVSEELRAGNRIRKDVITGQMEIIRTKQVPKNVNYLDKEYKIIQGTQCKLFKLKGLAAEDLLNEFEYADQELKELSKARKSKIIEK